MTPARGRSLVSARKDLLAMSRSGQRKLAHRNIGLRGDCENTSCNCTGTDISAIPTRTRMITFCCMKFCHLINFIEPRIDL